MKCKHSWCYTETYDGIARRTVTCRVCRVCDHWLSLGPANDASEEVQIEIAATWMANRFAPLDGRSNMTRDGWYCHRDGFMPSADTAGGWMGFLARQIATHDEGGSDGA
jgi:hypothetical protein